jgi:ECF transporter S component (folate family)
MKISSRQITTIGLLIALSIILTRVASIRIAIGGIEGIRIGFGELPIILGGIIFGPLAGGLIGAISDLLGYFINPIGAYMPHFTLVSSLKGIIPVLILGWFNQKREIKTGELILAIATGHIITSVLLVSYFLHIIFGLPWAILIPPRIIAAPINIAIYVYITKRLLRNNIINKGWVKSDTILP